MQKIVSLILFVSLCAFGSFAQQKPISKQFLLGRYNYRSDTSFVKVPGMYTDKTVYLKKETFKAFVKMRAAALKEGVTLTIISGTRSFYDQSNKWESKWDNRDFTTYTRKNKVVKMLKWWSMPGTSRHHWGTDVDLTNLNLSFYSSPKGKKMYAWMQANAAKYGFYQPFNANRPSGYQEEKWHWSYVPLARVYLSAYVKQISYADITGVKGAEVAGDIDIIKNWVLAVNTQCK